MAKNYFAPGNEMEFTTAGNVASGDVVAFGSILGIAANTTTGAGKVNVVSLNGVWKIAKAAPLVINHGDKLYWDSSAKTVSKTNTDPFIGYAFAPALSADAIAYVLLARVGS